ncbi:MAG: hypothetical protein P8Y63_04380 [Deltaproteobacteria bacterium]
MKKKNLVGLFVTLFLVALPLAATADQNSMEGMHGMNGMIVLGTDTQGGVKAMGHLMNVPEGDRSECPGRGPKWGDPSFHGDVQ